MYYLLLISSLFTLALAGDIAVFFYRVHNVVFNACIYMYYACMYVKYTVCCVHIYTTTIPHRDIYHTLLGMVCVCVCVCVFFPIILDIKFVGHTSRGHTGARSHRIFHPPSFCGACLIFFREKDSAIPFPRRPWNRILCTNDLIVLHLSGIFIFIFYLLVRKIPFAGIEHTSQRFRRLRGYLWATGATGFNEINKYNISI